MRAPVTASNASTVFTASAASAVFAVFTAVLLLSSPSSLAWGVVDDPVPAAGFVVGDGKAVDALPLRSQTTTVDVAGVVARVRIEQVWQNVGAVPLEASYVFPTSTRAALHDLRLTINDGRELRADVRPKEQAQKLFDAARDDGRTAALLEHQRANAVTMNVVNILPGDRIRVVIEASELLRSVDGTWELVLPQTLGPRYDGAAGSPSNDDGFVDNGFIAAGHSAVKTAVHLTVRSPIGVARVGSPTHGIAPEFTGRDEVQVHLHSGGDDVIADRDVVFRWQLASDETETGVLLFRDKEHDDAAGGGFFLLLGEAPPEVEADEAPPREVVFVVDVSGSMSGFPLDTAQALVADLIDELRPDDRFNLMFFAGSNFVVGKDGSLAPTAANKARALAALAQQQGGGGTELAAALRASFALPRDRATHRSRAIVVVTDGFVSAERAVFDDVRAHRGDATVFAFGIGDNVNRLLIEGLAAAGSTEPFVVKDAAQAERAALQFRTSAARPALTNLAVRFDGFAATDLEPTRPTDLFPGRPLVMLGRFTGPSSGHVVVTGTGLGGAAYEHVIAIEDNLERPSHAPLRQLWARERVARLADRGTPTAAELQEVERLGLRHRLLTERTSFVVVDSAVRNVSGDAAAVAQPLIEPRGVDIGSFGGLSGTFGTRGLGSGSLGSGALGGRGSGSGGGGVSSGVGSGSGGLALASSSGVVILRGRGGSTTSVGSGTIVYEGGMSRAEIQRVITRNMGQIKYCYERQLIAEPTLAGRLVVTWVIQPDGTVVSVVTTQPMSGARSAQVQECVQRVVARLQFPAPKGGGKVNVTYPFVFTNDSK